MRLRGPVLLLLAACFAAAPIATVTRAVAWAGNAAGSDVRPVILIHGLGGSPTVTWGWGKRDSFYGRLVRAGYVPDVTLFAVDYGDQASGDFTAIAARLPEVIDIALRASGFDSVDLVTHSMGGLVARHYVTSSAYRGDVASVAMICTPNRGSFAATAALLERYALKMDAPSDQGSGGFPDATEERIRARVDGVYEPLYADYSTIRTRAARPEMTGMLFEEWLSSQRPEIIQMIKSESEEPHYSHLPASIPTPEEGLTDGYYEFMALHLGRRQYLRKHALSRPKWAVTRVLQRAKSIAERLLYHGLTSVFNIQPGQPALMRMVEECVRIPTGRSGGVFVYEDLPANWYLARWNQHDEMGRRIETARHHTKPRYIIVAAEAPNIAGYLWDTVGPNDIVVEVESVYLRPGPDDLYTLCGGPLAFHGTPLANGALTEWLAGKLRGPHGSELPEQLLSTGTLELSDWRPAYVAFTSGSHTGRVTIRSEPVPDAAAVHAWVDAGGLRETVGDRIVATAAEATGDGALTIELPPGKALWLGARIESGSQTHLKESHRTVRYEITLGPAPDLTADRVPRIVVKAGRDTTDARSVRSDGSRVTWDFGDGSTEEDHSPERVDHRFKTPGAYRVSAVARDEFGETTARWEWKVEVQHEDQQIGFERQVPVIVEPSISIVGPARWVTGRPALFTVDISDLALNGQVIRIDPGRQFSVVWARPDHHPVRAAVTVRYSFVAGDAALVVTRTYLASTIVDVMALSTAS